MSCSGEASSARQLRRKPRSGLDRTSMMTDEDAAAVDARHLTLRNVDKFWANGVAVEIPMPGTPVCRLRIDPGHDEMSLVTPLEGPEPDIARYRNIEVQVFADGEDDWAEI